MLAFALTIAPLAFKCTVALPLIFFAFGFFGAATNSYFALLTPYYPPGIVGRANAVLNMLLFATIFFLQWGIGVVVNLYRTTGAYSADGFSVAFTILLIAQVLVTAWLWPAREGAASKPDPARA